jgi:hypothetical protein
MVLKQIQSRLAAVSTIKLANWLTIELKIGEVGKIQASRHLDIVRCLTTPFPLRNVQHVADLCDHHNEN